MHGTCVLLPDNPVNTGKHSSEVDMLLVHSLYFALINVSLKLEVCVEASYLLLLILLEIIQDGILDQCQCLRLTDKRYLLS